ncbi:ADP compounds hydrolase NudE [Aquisalimonas sp.]|uniref:ADP compounds hydrolase NudE n=1 Tax=unclassified Aquisalimonas TaxID=2644645 RepID=UPI0025C4F9CC|nr:ADP compounds hydrolase NudE [Aquisalimonas sp.]
MADKPEILDTRTVAQSQLFRVEAVDLRFSNGAEVTFERMRGSGRVGAVIIVPVTGDGTLKLIREYGVGTERYELGLPKGRVEPGEDMLVAANREIMEEIGYAAERLTPLRALSLAPGYFGHRTQVVLAEGLYPDPAPGDEPEPLEVVDWPLADLESLVLEDEFSEGRSIAALYLARDFLRQREGGGGTLR